MGMGGCYGGDLDFPRFRQPAFLVPSELIGFYANNCSENSYCYWGPELPAFHRMLSFLVFLEFDVYFWLFLWYFLLPSCPPEALAAFGLQRGILWENSPVQSYTTGHLPFLRVGVTLYFWLVYLSKPAILGHVSAWCHAGAAYFIYNI